MELTLQKTCILYCRVSSAEQVEGTSLDTQERACRAYAEKEDLRVLEVFVEKGESAKTTNRTEFNRAILFCTSRKLKVDYFVVYKLDRFSRNQDDHGIVRANLKRYGTALRSATEPINETPTGRLMEAVISGVAEFDNSVRSDRSKGGMIEKVRQGIWVWSAPLGYKRLTKGGNITPDETTAPYIREAFEEWSKGVHTYQSLATFLYQRGLRTRSGGKIYPQLIEKILRNHIYCGLIKVFGMEVKGIFTPIVEEDVFYKCQLKVRGGHSKARKAVNPDFPLRGKVICGQCGGKLTASYSHGNGGKYPYYHHYKQGCPKAEFTPKSTLEQNFLEFLGEISPKHRKYEKAFKAIVINVWKSNYKRLDAENERIRKELSNLEAERQKVFDLHLTGTYSNQEFQEQKDRLNLVIQQKKIYLEEKRIEEFNMEEALNHCFEFVRDSGKTWQELAQVPAFQSRFQNMVFPHGNLTYNDGKFGTEKMSLVYEINQQSGADSSKVVTPRGIEPRFQA